MFTCNPLYTYLQIKVLLITHRYYYHTGDDRPDIKDLNRHIFQQQAAQWERLGIELGLKDYQIAYISKDNTNSSVTCCRVMLQKWLNIEPSATWGKLDDAIKNIMIKLPSTTSSVSIDKGGNHGYKYLVTIIS